MTETRAEKAQRLVDEGRVKITCDTAHYKCGRVRSNQHTYFVIIYVNSHFNCTCRWGDDHSQINDLCAHALAVKLAVQKEREHEQTD